MFSKTVSFVFIAAFIVLGFSDKGFGQNAPQPTDAPAKETAKEGEVKSATQAVQSPSGIKVTFDESAPGIMIIESNGEKIRVDANKKTVEQLAVALPEKTAETTQGEATAQTEAGQDEKESQFDFDSGEEPYDYRLVNIPTAKKVPKGTINLSFTHRFTQPIHPIKESGRNLLGFDSFSVSAFGVSYGITDKLFVSASRSPICQKGLCRTIELGLGYQWLEQNKKQPVSLITYASIEGNGNFTEEYNYNIQALVSSRVHKRIYLFFAPAVHINANGQNRFNPRADEFFPPAVEAVNNFKLPKHAASFGFGASVLITPSLSAMFDFTPRTGFKLGRVDAIFDRNFNVLGFKNESHPSIGFGIQKNVGKHAFTLTFSNTQTTSTSRYNSSNLVLSPRNFVVGFNLFRRFGR